MALFESFLFFFPPPTAFRVSGFEALSFPKMRASVPKTVKCRQKRRAKAVCTAQRAHFRNPVHILALASSQRLVFETTIWIGFLFFRFAGHMIARPHRGRRQGQTRPRANSGAGALQCGVSHDRGRLGNHDNHCYSQNTKYIILVQQAEGIIELSHHCLALE